MKEVCLDSRGERGGAASRHGGMEAALHLFLEAKRLYYFTIGTS